MAPANFDYEQYYARQNDARVYTGLINLAGNVTMSHSTYPEAPLQMRKIFIGGLPYNCSRDALFVYFIQFGPIQDAVMMCDTVTKQPRGFGFVTFMKEDSVELAINSGPHTILGKLVDVKRAVSKSQLANPQQVPQVHELIDTPVAPGTKVTITSITDGFGRPSIWNFGVIKVLHDYFIQFGQLEMIERDSRGETYLVFEKHSVACDVLKFNGGRHIYNQLLITVQAPSSASTADDFRYNHILN